MKIRIVTDDYNGYEVQVWRWWLPIWRQHGYTNTHSSVEGAKRYIKRNVLKKKFVSEVVEIVEVA